jgi:predicted transcriptional regulator
VPIVPTEKLSRLELYLEILKSIETLSDIADIQEKTNVDGKVLQNAIAFLEKQNLIEKENDGKQVLYRNTESGIKVSRFFGTKFDTPKETLSQYP